MHSIRRLGSNTKRSLSMIGCQRVSKIRRQLRYTLSYHGDLMKRLIMCPHGNLGSNPDADKLFRAKCRCIKESLTAQISDVIHFGIPKIVISSRVLTIPIL